MLQRSPLEELTAWGQGPITTLIYSEPAIETNVEA